MKENFTQEHIAAFHHSDQQAIHLLFREHYSPLVNTAAQLTDNRQEAREIVLTTFVKLIALRAGFKNPADIRAYLLISVRTASYDYIDAIANAPQPTSDDLLTLADLVPTTSEQIWQNDTETILAVYDIIISLPEPAEELFKLLFFNKITTEQAAIELGITTEEAFSRRTTLLKHFHQQLNFITT